MMLETISDAVVYVNGSQYFGTTNEVKLPEIQFKTTERKPTGGIGSIELPAGVDKLEAEITWASYDKALAASVFNPRKSAQLMVRSVKRVFDGAGSISKELPVVTTMTVLPKSFGLGTHKQGEPIEAPSKFAVHAIRQTVDGAAVVEIDVINQVFKMGDEDFLSTVRNILGI